MGAIQNDWLQAVGGEFRKPYYKELYDFVKEEYSTRVIYPPADDIFNALHLTPLKEGLKQSFDWYLQHPDEVQKKPFMHSIDENLCL